MRLHAYFNRPDQRPTMVKVRTGNAVPRQRGGGRSHVAALQGTMLCVLRACRGTSHGRTCMFPSRCCFRSAAGGGPHAAVLQRDRKEEASTR
jgi:hypothetical protein